MNGTWATIAGLALCLALPVAAAAQDLPTGREAQRLVFAANGAVEGEVIAHESLDATDLAILEQLIPTQKYYAAIAIAPGEGLASPATMAAANFHDEYNARRVALEGCNAARRDGEECVVVLVIRPEGWEAGRAVQLNTDATAALRSAYRRVGRPRLMAISPGTGNWGVGGSAEDAISECGITDCEVVIAN